jgi:release factor glutamine methyltransferase
MTYREAYEEGVKKLEEHGVPDADLDAFYLLEYASGGRLSRARYLACREDNIEDALLEPYRELLALRQKRIPLQQITGSQEFCGLNFLVNGNVLIPRQDTETLVEEALRLLRPGMRVLDLCTGSGCIIISLKKLCPGIEAYACDLSAEALVTAGQNAKNSGTGISFFQGDLFDAVPAGDRYDMIVSNPPYIESGEIDSLMEEVRLYEPRMALDGGEDGLAFYRRIIAAGADYLTGEGWLVFETGCSQGGAVAGLMEKSGFSKVRVCRDLAGMDRVVMGRRPADPQTC